MLAALADLLLPPPRCHGCKKPVVAGALHLCPDCYQKLSPVTTPLCTCCGDPFATVNGMDHLCGPCITTPPHFDAARSAYLFTEPLSEMIHRFKYGQQVRLRRPLALLLLDRLTPFITESAPDLLLPVPLHTRRLRQRSFNQSLLIAEFLAGELSLPLARNLLQRHRWTEPQVQLPAAERIANVRNAFSLANPSAVAGKRILLVDDVFTTGSTLTECSRILVKAKAAAVFGVTVARAPLGS